MIGIIGRVVYCSRGIMIYIWLCICPLFRHYTKADILEVWKFFKFCGKYSRRSLKLDEAKKKQFDELMDAYLNMNSFLYSSLNMEMVCVILKGINVVLREINLDKDSQNYSLDQMDFIETKVARLKTVQVINRNFFEKVSASNLKQYQNQRNDSAITRTEVSDLVINTQRNDSAVENEFL